MSVATTHEDKDWPPGTVRIEDLFQGDKIIQQPRPTSDPNDPLNWSRWRKYLNFGLACTYVMLVYADVNAVTPTWGPMNEYGFSYDILNDSYATGCAGLALGGPLLIPFALKYGRRPVYILSLLSQFAIAIWTAKLETVGDLIAVNTLNCFLGALCEIMVQMTIADCFFVHQRGRMNSFYVWFLFIGGSLAPLAAGYVTVDQGWRWVWWWMVILFGISIPIYIFGFEETKYVPKHDGIEPVELQDPLALASSAHLKALEPDSKAADGETNAFNANTVHSTDVEIDHSIPLKSYRQRLSFLQTSPGSWSQFFRHAYQPLQIFVSIPAVFYICLVYAIINSTMTIAITVSSEYLYDPPWNFNSADVGLMSLPPFIGISLGLLVTGPVSDWIILRLAKRNNGIYEPEMRLWVIAAFVPFLPAGAFMFGIGLGHEASWGVTAVGFGMLAFGTAPAASIALTYMTDSYQDIIADSMVALTVTRNIVATIFVFAISPWIDGIGVQNVFIMCGVLMTVIVGSVFIFIFFGKRLRVKAARKYRYFAERQYATRVM
ncbi:synaptic vesicle transporter [Exophiala viscosa]|uniref:Synaptic vesicle transporter n=1 Tax=Exophiala viscosa TaxID=2486360 RepID=A0AAN6DST4_9EURO|nr:synaptic vesicle transporter [Exophiala viscosa]